MARKDDAPPPLPTFWELEAAVTLKLLLKRHRVSYKKLSRALAGYGEKMPISTVSSRINRGKFPVSFFIECMCAIGLHDEVRVPLPSISANELAVIKAAAKDRSKRKMPAEAVAAANKARAPRRKG